jgi:hypothetical protein
MNPENYINHSGGAPGSDQKWDEIGRKFGFTNHKHWRPEHLKDLNPQEREQMLKDVKSAAIALKRPFEFKGIELVQRNWFPACHAQAVYAIGYIIKPGELEPRGFINKTGKEKLAGGTAWAVEMAIQKGKGVAVFDMKTDLWYVWEHSPKRFFPVDYIPTLTEVFAGIGSRVITSKGENAINNVYMATLIKLKS